MSSSHSWIALLTPFDSFSFDALWCLGNCPFCFLGPVFVLVLVPVLVSVLGSSLVLVLVFVLILVLVLLLVLFVVLVPVPVPILVLVLGLTSLSIYVSGSWFTSGFVSPLTNWAIISMFCISTNLLCSFPLVSAIILSSSFL